jgi:DNA polymerase-3 subunit delta'
MSVFSEIVGQSKAIETLTRALHSPTHAWLFTGPPGSGRSNIAKAFAASLVCPNQGCGICTDCQTALLGSHPDVEIFATEGVTIKVDEIRELVSRSTWGASIAPWRITIIEDSDRMTESAANALLKAIEEPASRSIWLLCAPTSDDVLPTIRSRCLLITLTTPTTDQVSNYLQNQEQINKSTADLAATIAQGHVGRARHYAKDVESLALRKKIINLFLSITNESSAISVASQLQDIATNRAETRSQERSAREEELLRATIQGPNRSFLSGGSKALKELEKAQKSRTTRAIRDELDTYFLWLQAVIRDALIENTDQSESFINPDLTQEIRTLASKMSSRQLEILTRKVNQYRASLDSTAAQLLTLEFFCLEFLGAIDGH